MKKSIFLFVFIFFVLNVFAKDMKHLNSSDELVGILNSNNVVLVDFFATWCPPCQMLGPILEGLAKEMSGKAAFVKIDVDKFGDLAQKYNISGIPDVRIFKNGKEVKKLVGLQSKSVYKKEVERLSKK